MKNGHSIGLRAGGAGFLCLIGLSGCQSEMWTGAKVKPLEPSPVFVDGRSSRPLLADTVSRTDVIVPDATITGRGANDALVTVLPVPLTRELLDRGQQRYEIYCAPCHGPRGYGNGMIVQRGFPAPPSYHISRLRNAPIGHFFDVMTNGYGVMYSYNDRVSPPDRWAIAAYIRTLQRSQNASPTDVPPGMPLKETGYER